MDVADDLKHRLAALGLTQTAWAAWIGRDAVTVNRWAVGTVDPDPAALRALELLERLPAGQWPADLPRRRARVRAA